MTFISLPKHEFNFIATIIFSVDKQKVEPTGFLMDSFAREQIYFA